MKKFEITYYWGPHGIHATNEQNIKAIAECGFTSIPLEINTAENNKKALKLMKKYALTCSALWDKRINDLFGQNPQPSQENIDSVISEVTADYGLFDNIDGWYIMDEPNSSHFPILKKIVSAFHRIAPNYSAMINLFPNYATPEQLGANYYEYIRQFTDDVKPDYLSYDHYHFFDGNKKPRREFFSNLNTIATVGKEKNIDQMQIILLTKHMNYADVTPEQIKYEVNMSLVYGMKRISYFTFWLDESLVNDGWTNSCMSYTGEIYPHYYDVQRINKWLITLGNELFDKKTNAVFHITESDEAILEPDCVKYISYGKVGKISGNDFVIGFFDDGCFMLVNKKYTPGKAGDNSVKLNEISSGLEFFDTQCGKWCTADNEPFFEKDENGKYTLKFESAQGILFRII